MLFSSFWGLAALSPARRQQLFFCCCSEIIELLKQPGNLKIVTIFNPIVIKQIP